MNKILVISIIVVIGFIIVGISFNDNSQENIGDVTVEETLDSEKKSYSISLTESVNISTP